MATSVIFMAGIAALPTKHSVVPMFNKEHYVLYTPP